ncbi:GGDEF domain-containing protein [Methylobacterium radiodurans]|uniref:GGDEF domain-containing protein n=1 Tax=Methylobacterium radiodurans TaxID=2202828 RepID=A0A2U8VU85_9HYPH|nr:GGDEF domain-containing protein [Methylobacterium radiodurans]AWN37267.1 hypothetical protein DK427_17305 [Methylobacterium radiodurans]
MIAQPDPVDHLVLRDRADTLLASLPLTLLSNIFVSLSFCTMMWGSLPTGLIGAWAVLNAAINLARLWIARWVRQRGLLDTAPGAILNFAWIGALLSGLCWTAALVACAQVGQAYTIATGLTFCGINAGAVIQNRTDRASTLAFVLPSCSVLILICLGAGSLQAVVMGINMTLLTLMMVRAAGLAERSYVATARLRHEADHLAASLQRANVAAAQAMRQLDHAANHDPLTDLANRAAYRQAFEDRLARAARGEGELTTMLIDLDRFKAINDTHGHAAGDAVLVAVADRLRSVLGPDDVAARLGGDEFALLLFRERMGAEDARIAERIVRALAAPLDLAGRTVRVGGSVGFARFPGDGESLQDLQIAADVALYAAKSEGRGTWRGVGDVARRSAGRDRSTGRDQVGRPGTRPALAG